MTPFLPADLCDEEGRVASAYPDPLSPLGRACAQARIRLANYRQLAGWRALDGAPWTIGVGHTGREVREGLTWGDQAIDAQLAHDIAACVHELDQALPWWRTLSDPRQDVMVQMAFQMGVSGELKFVRTLAAIRSGRFDQAAEGMLASAWARQTPGRAKRLAEQMRSGVRLSR